MQEFFTYATLETLAGAITATVLMVEFLKEFKILKHLPTRWLAFAVAQLTVFIAAVAGDKFAAKNLPLYFLNGLLVAACAMGGWQIIYRRLSGTSGNVMKNGRNGNNYRD